jgi:hypothetical protein
VIERPDWPYLFGDAPPFKYEAFGLTGNLEWPPGGSWPAPGVSSSAGNGPIIGGWIMAIMHQWFLRNPDGTEIPEPSPGVAPVTYETRNYKSMQISIHELAAATSGTTNLLANSPPGAAQQETQPAGSPASVGSNGQPRIDVPTNNVIGWGYDGNAAPEGLLAMGWQEKWHENIHIETEVPGATGSSTILVMHGVPVPDYFGGGSVPSVASGAGGVFLKRYIDNWWQSTAGNSTLSVENGLRFSYFAAVISSHLVGYGVGLVDSSFTSFVEIPKEQDIMNSSALTGMSAFITALTNFQFTSEDLVRMQDVINGDYTAPGPRSTLPGSHRD